MTPVTATLTYSTGSEALIGHVLVKDGITIRRGKANAFGATEATTCSFTARRTIMQTAAWRNTARTTETLTLVVNGSTRFTGWWWKSEEDIFDPTGNVRITLVSTGIKTILEDTRQMRWGSRALAGKSDAVAFCAIDKGLLDRGQIVDGEKTFSEIVRPYTASGGLQKLIIGAPSNLPQLESGDRNVYATDARYAIFPGTSVSPPFRLTFTMNAPPSLVSTGTQAANLVKLWTETFSVDISILPSSNIGVRVINRVTSTAYVNSSVPWASETTASGELWHFVIEVSESGGNVHTVVGARPMSRAEGRLGDLAGVFLTDDTSATPAGGVGPITRVEFGPNAGVSPPNKVADLITSDILLQSTTGGLIGSDEFLHALGGLTLTSLSATWVPYFGLTSQVSAGTYDISSPTIPPGPGADQLAAIEEVYRTVYRDSRTADFTVIRSGADYVPVQVTEVALGTDFLRVGGQAGEESSIEVVVPDSNYIVTVNPYGAEWQRNRSRKWARLPVNLDSATKRAVDVGASLVSFISPVGSLFRGRVVGIEELVMPAVHTASWVLEEWPQESQIVTDSAVVRPDSGSALAASVNATYSGGSSLTVDATYSAYDTPFTVRPAAASRYSLVISGVSGTTWTINTGASTLPPSLAVGDQLNFDNAAIAF